MNNVNSPGLPAATERDSSARVAARQQQEDGKQLPVQTAAQAPQQTPRVTELRENIDQDMQEIVSDLNNYAQSLQRDLRFAVDGDLNRSVVSVIDRESQEVIRQIPSEVALKLARNLKDRLQDVASNPPPAQTPAQGKGGFSLGIVNTEI